MPKQNSESVPQQMQPVYDEITRLTDAVCRDHVDEEFAQLCRKLAAALARKRPSPLARGKKEVWACAVMYALGQINFLFDRSQTPHTTPGELCVMFGVAQSPNCRGTKHGQQQGQADSRYVQHVVFRCAVVSPQ